MRVLPVGAFLLFAAHGPGAIARAATADGAALYREHCAGCHGKDGGGDGPLAADLRFKPRAFKEGKFAFGNTPDAMAKTIQSGVPGQDVARMPAFLNVLSEEDLATLVAYVRGLMPPMPELTPADMKMEPRDCALIVRGILAPLREGEGPLARGLLVGLPSGFSFEYATELVHLVSVRRGEFLTRSDWEGRGGRPLTPLGAPLWTSPEPEGWSPFALGSVPEEGEHVQWSAAYPQLRATTAIEGFVEIGYDLLDADGIVRAHIVERPRDVVTAVASGVSQELEIEAAGAPVAVRWSIAIASDPALPLPAPAGLLDAIAAGTPPRVRHSSEQLSIMGSTGGWWVVRPPDGSFACVRIDAPEDALLSNFNGEKHDCVDVEIVAAHGTQVVRRVVLFGPKIEPDSFAGISNGHLGWSNER
jgi:mono/diheme cytochrome c family protein